MSEQWKVMKNGRFSVSSKGKVYNWMKDRFVIQWQSNGYNRVSLQIEVNKRKKYSVARLVALAFLPNPLKLKTVDHINGIRNDNRIENLQWLSRGDNVIKEQAGYYSLVDPKGRTIEIFNMEEFCRNNNLDSANIHRVMKSRQTHHRGWTKCQNI